MRRRHRECGTAAVEFVFVAPILIVVFLLIVGLGRMAHARQQVEGVAADAARAASLERNTSLSKSAGMASAKSALADAGLACTSLDVNVDISDYRPGGAVTATVTCVAQLGDVTLSGLPGKRTFVARSSVPIETYRSK